MSSCSSSFWLIKLSTSCSSSSMLAVCGTSSSTSSLPSSLLFLVLCWSKQGYKSGWFKMPPIISALKCYNRIYNRFHRPEELKKEQSEQASAVWSTFVNNLQQGVLTTGNSQNCLSLKKRDSHFFNLPPRLWELALVRAVDPHSFFGDSSYFSQCTSGRWSKLTLEFFWVKFQSLPIFLHHICCYLSIFPLLDLYPHIECGSGRENECGSIRNRIHSPGFNTQ